MAARYNDDEDPELTADPGGDFSYSFAGPAAGAADPSAAAPAPSSYGNDFIETPTFSAPGDHLGSADGGTGYNPDAGLRPGGNARIDGYNPDAGLRPGGNARIDGYNPDAGAQNDLRQQVQSLQSEPDPSAKAVAQDKLARDVYSQLQAAGHDVKWDGDNIVVDGRSYTLAGSAANGSLNDLSRLDPKFNPRDAVVAQGADSWEAQLKQRLGSLYDPSILGDVQRNVGYAPGSGMDTAGQTPQSIIDRIVNKNLLRGSNEPNSTYVADGKGGYTVGPTGRINYGPGKPTGQVAAAGGLRASGNARIDGYNPNGLRLGDNPNGLGVTGYNPDSGDPHRGSSSPSEGIPPNGSDLPDFSFQSLLGNMNGSSVDPQVQSLISRILANPESLDPHTVDTLKAKSKQDIAEMQATDEENMRHAATAGHFDDSPWLASERLASQRGRDNSIIDSNRNIDVNAASTNTADRRAAAQLGTGYADTMAARQRANVGTAGNLALQKAGIVTQRRGQDQQASQFAQSLGLDYARLSQQDRQYVQSLMEQQSEFGGRLSFDYANLGQQNSQFGADYGLNAANLQNQTDQQNFERYITSLLLGGGA